MKKILILYTMYGTGHYMAAKGIEDDLRERYPNYKVELFDPFSYAYPKINKLFAGVGRLMATRLRKFRNLIYKKTMYQNYTKNFWYMNLGVKFFWTKKLKNKLLEFNPDIIISTQVGPTAVIAEHKDLFDAKLVVVYTDYGVHRLYVLPHKDVDLFCVPTDGIKNEMIDLGVDKNKIKVTGIPVCKKFRKKDTILKKVEIITKKVTKIKPTFLFVCGGGMGYDNAFTYFEFLLQSKYEFKYIFVAGRNEELVKRATELANKHKKKGKIYGYVKNMDELMYSSDMVIGKPGGIITSECLNTITPLCAVEPIPGQEIKNSLFVNDNKFGFYIESKEKFMDLLKDIDSGKIKLDDYRKNIKKNFVKFSFIDIDKIK